MSFVWQDLIVLALVAAAAGYLLRQAWLVLARKKSGGCGSGCGKCPASETAAPATVVSVESLAQTAPRKS